jgi:hypothetical protein
LLQQSTQPNLKEKSKSTNWTPAKNMHDRRTLSEKEKPKLTQATVQHRNQTKKPCTGKNLISSKINEADPETGCAARMLLCVGSWKNEAAQPD